MSPMKLRGRDEKLFTRRSWLKNIYIQHYETVNENTVIYNAFHRRGEGEYYPIHNYYLLRQ